MVGACPTTTTSKYAEGLLLTRAHQCYVRGNKQLRSLLLTKANDLKVHENRTSVGTTDIVSACGQQPKSKESGLRVNKTFSESEGFSDLADGGGPRLVRRETRKRRSADRRKEKAGLTVPKVASPVVCLCWARGGGKPGPIVLLLAETSHLPFPFGGSGKVRDLEYLGLGLREREGKKKKIERRGANAEE